MAEQATDWRGTTARFEGVWNLWLSCRCPMVYVWTAKGSRHRRPRDWDSVGLRVPRLGLTRPRPTLPPAYPPHKPCIHLCRRFRPRYRNPPRGAKKWAGEGLRGSTLARTRPIQSHRVDRRTSSSSNSLPPGRGPAAQQEDRFPVDLSGLVVRGEPIVHSIT